MAPAPLQAPERVEIQTVERFLEGLNRNQLLWLGAVGSLWGNFWFIQATFIAVWYDFRINTVSARTSLIAYTGPGATTYHVTFVLFGITLLGSACLVACWACFWLLKSESPKYVRDIACYSSVIVFLFPTVGLLLWGVQFGGVKLSDAPQDGPLFSL
jgi:hypothetical protein